MKDTNKNKNKNKNNIFGYLGKWTVLVALVFSTGLAANSEEMDEVEEEVSKLMVRFDKNSLVEISNQLLKMAYSEDSDGDYYNAIKHYRQSIRLRDMMGMSTDKGYANLLYLTSISEHNFGASCDAKEHAEIAVKLYQYLNQKVEADLAQKDLVSFRNACMVLMTQN
jgi:hypothetical protein